LAVTSDALVMVRTAGESPPLVPSKIAFSWTPSPNFGTGPLEAPASRSSRSREPNDSRAASVPQSIRMRTSS
jgi:hypothetical protein